MLADLLIADQFFARNTPRCRTTDCVLSYFESCQKQFVVIDRRKTRRHLPVSGSIHRTRDYGWLSRILIVIEGDIPFSILSGETRRINVTRDQWRSLSEILSRVESYHRALSVDEERDVWGPKRPSDPNLRSLCSTTNFHMPINKCPRYVHEYTHTQPRQSGFGQ